MRAVRATLRPILIAAGLGGCVTEFPEGGVYACASNADCAGENVCRVSNGERLCLPPDPRCPTGVCSEGVRPRMAGDDAGADAAPPRPPPELPLPDSGVAEEDAAAPAPGPDAGDEPPEPPRRPGPCPQGEFADDGLRLVACGNIDEEAGHCRYEFAAETEAYTCVDMCSLFDQRCAAAADDDPEWWCSPVPSERITCSWPGRSLVCDCID